MKKILILLPLLISAFFANAQYQYRDESKVKLGLTAHPTFGWIRSDMNNVTSDGARVGFTYGLLADFLFEDNYAFSTGLKLTTINGKTSSSLGTNSSKEIYKLQYIEIPAKIKLLTNDNDGFRFYGEFGLGNAINVRAKQDAKFLSSAPTENVDISKQIAFYRGSIIIGAGTEFNPSGKTRIMAGLTFDNGFTDIKKGSGTLKSSYLGLNIGVFF